MRKLGGLLLVLGLGVFIWKQSDRNVQEDVGAAYQYRVAELADIYQIEIDEPGQTLVVLEREKDYWTLNNKYRARPNAIQNLLAAISKIELQFIPQQAGVKTILDVLQKQGIHVKIFDRSGTLIKSFVIGGVTPDERGTFILLDGFDQPGVVSLPGFDGSLVPMFRIPLLDWRDRTVLGAEVDEINRISLEYPDRPQHSFKILRRENNIWEVGPLNAPIGQGLVQNRGAIEAYLRAFKRLGAESIIENDDLMNHLKSRDPFVKVSLVNLAGRVQEASFYPVAVRPDAPVIAQIDRYHVLDQSGNIYLVQHRVFREIFRSFEFFVESD